MGWESVPREEGELPHDWGEEAGRTKEESLFWSSIDMSGEHWFYKSKDMTPAEARNQVWEYMYAPVLKGYFLELWCHNSDCVRVQHMFIGKKPHKEYAMRKRFEVEREGSKELQKDRRKKITDKDVDRIHELRAEGMSYNKIAVIIGISRKTAQEIGAGKRRKKKADPKTGRLYINSGIMEGDMPTPEQKKQYWKKHYDKNKDKITAKVRQSREENREEFRRKQREYREANKERMLERERAYYHKKRDKILANKRESQRIRSKITYWKTRDIEKYEQACQELADYNESRRRKKMEEETKPAQNTPMGKELKKEEDKPVSVEEAESAHEGAQGFEKSSSEKFGT